MLHMKQELFGSKIVMGFHTYYTDKDSGSVNLICFILCLKQKLKTM